MVCNKPNVESRKNLAYYVFWTLNRTCIWKGSYVQSKHPVYYTYLYTNASLSIWVMDVVLLVFLLWTSCLHYRLVVNNNTELVEKKKRFFNELSPIGITGLFLDVVQFSTCSKVGMLWLQYGAQIDWDWETGGHSLSRLQCKWPL